MGIPQDGRGQIDPTMYSKYGIHSVPALVVYCSEGYDVIWGNLRLKQTQGKVAAGGDYRVVVERLLQNEPASAGQR